MLKKRYYILTYKYIQDTFYKRIPFRDQHQKLIQDIQQNNTKVIAGNYFPLDGAVILFESENEKVAEEFVKSDPYVKNGLVSEYDVKEYDFRSKRKFEDIAKYFTYR